MTKKYQKCSFCNKVLQMDLAAFITSAQTPVCQECFFNLVYLIAEREETMLSDDSNEEF
ncbi:hypothetical protein MmiAt1_16540 [Methanimicrococcus sp. At1]|uniref:Uncharacterized protein n=1 Tax=Methanimicrococcus hacksteinii TaxID=3028293 RepID=A0ABU3VRK8_9EURY|nr:hypothetical protein [Methanimicrococcus sp. At1]MDV0446044.1 hypothetical protein [Methanimicrococcus sp. At1]